MDLDIRELTTSAERREAVPILRQLWTDRSPDEVLAWTGDEQYRLFGGYVDDGSDVADADETGRESEPELVAVAGVLVTHVLHHTRRAWLYDLVVDEPRRGQGYGTVMLEEVESWADEQGCDAVALASPRSKEATHEFYEARGYERWGYVIEKRC
ncbi:GNAT family N-acetyltransferase [Halopiger xanaduensis]|uniref:GCN5-related N-acetyltransferase n=1 Tax=Halopiger xanaduensis (strain DSM 18323 / JCM 14033 / SH-6) TaxID=797210 RepID=F8D303_HALXS|nr:GNAT family N-acetyltransferase [Halopiger xanaduensis]AEH36155.1 GCN5-related N-acetyltransferase [Halopiger xanaduensis SH-6]